mmetsp:Transcript_4077/g.6463  ORF Transcript_4077/g.6463 Transcript_4077/m.6463 type:complete len:103 (-) Transcript_4077:1425-1733(-)
MYKCMYALQEAYWVSICTTLHVCLFQSYSSGSARSSSENGTAVGASVYEGGRGGECKGSSYGDATSAALLLEYEFLDDDDGTGTLPRDSLLIVGGGGETRSR